jgi:hypothetical protein
LAAKATSVNPVRMPTSIAYRAGRGSGIV